VKGIHLNLKSRLSTTCLRQIQVFLEIEKLTLHGKNGFVTATKLGTTNKFFVAATKNFVDRTKHFVVTKYFCYPYFNKMILLM